MEIGADMSVRQGRFDEHVEISSHVTVQGALTEGATVRNGGALVLQGSIAGSLHIEEGGKASIQGTLSGDVKHEGILKVGGVITEELPATDSGVTLIAPGSVFTGANASSILRHDGVLERLEGSDIKVEIDAGQPFMRLMEDGTFSRSE